jgi:2-C-methyl-D-erythritol 4-phosphate cytidylyltransferase
MSMVGLIVAAAGTGTRFGGNEEKALAVVHGRPMLAWTLLAFDGFDDIVERVVTVPSEREDVFHKRVLDGLDLRHPVRLVAGGAERQDSVARGLAALTDRAEWVLVHDAARPLVTKTLIRRVIGALMEGESVVPALHPRDSVARTGFEGWIKAYENRDRLVSVQTPQGFHHQVLDHAIQRARADKFHGTDEASLVLRLEHPVTWTHGEITNIKITYPEDVDLAEALLARREAEAAAGTKPTPEAP